MIAHALIITLIILSDYRFTYRLVYTPALNLHVYIINIRHVCNVTKYKLFVNVATCSSYDFVIIFIQICFLLAV